MTTTGTILTESSVRTTWLAAWAGFLIVDDRGTNMLTAFLQPHRLLSVEGDLDFTEHNH